MYGSPDGLGPIASTSGTAVLAYTGTGSMLAPLIVAGLALTMGTLLVLRRRMLERRTENA